MAFIMNGQRTVVGLGPGNLQQLTPEASRALERADCLFGYSKYLERVPERAGQARRASNNRQELERAAQALKEAAAGAMRGILAYNDLPLVSMDFNHDAHSSIFDATLTKVIDGTLVKVCAWYDNEWGFSNRMIDTTVAWSKAA